MELVGWDGRGARGGVDLMKMPARGLSGSLGLLGVLLGVFGVECAAGALENPSGLARLGALPDSGGLHGQYWRLLTFGLLHWNAFHLMLNSLLLLVAGPTIQRRLGAGWLMATFAIASVVSGMAILYKHVLAPAAGVSVGASGGMFGLLGLALMLVWLAPAKRPTRIVITLVVLCGFAYSFSPGVSMVGHIAGFAAGLAMATAAAKLRPNHSSKPTPLRGADQVTC